MRDKWTLNLLAQLAFLAAGPPALQAEITNAADVRHLEPDQARKEQAVHIHGVVTWVNLNNGELFVQDATAGVFVFIRNSTSDAQLRAGQAVELYGVTAPGDFSSSITKARIHVSGLAAMPPPLRLPFERILTGEQDSQWGHLEGVVRSGREQAGVLYLNAVTPGGAFLAIMRDYPRDWPDTLIDSKLSFEGVLAAVFNDHRQVSGVRIFVPGSNFLHLDEPAPAPPFELPRSSAMSVGAFRPDQDWSHRLRVRATVTATVSRSLMYVSEGPANLAVALDGSCDGRPGELVDVIGFPGTVDGRPGLRNGACRSIGGGTPVEPVELPARDIVPVESAEQGSGLSIANGMRNDLKLLTVAGTLIQISRNARSQTLTLASGDQNFSVNLPDSVSWLGDSIEPGTQLKATGVCLIAYDEYHRAQSFRLLARDASDLAVTSRPSWLTMSHALWIIIPMALLVLASIGWISILRRHVATKTKELSSANQRLQQAVAQDGLTGASNRRHFDEMLATELKNSAEHSTPLSLVMIDIDHFKAVNDLYGHQRGDQCLVRVVCAVRRAIAPRSEALVARYGGEEFTVLLPETGGAAAAAVAENIRRAVKEMGISHQRSPFDQRLTVSLGVATSSPPTPYLAEELISMADRALYQAKQLGRDRVMTFRESGTGEPSYANPAEWALSSAGSQLPLS